MNISTLRSGETSPFFLSLKHPSTVNCQSIGEALGKKAVWFEKTTLDELRAQEAPLLVYFCLYTDEPSWWSTEENEKSEARLNSAYINLIYALIKSGKPLVIIACQSCDVFLDIQLWPSIADKKSVDVMTIGFNPLRVSPYWRLRR